MKSVVTAICALPIGALLSRFQGVRPRCLLSMRQQILDTLAVLAVVLLFGALSYWLHWDDTDPINYRIETPKPFREARFIKV